MSRKGIVEYKGKNKLATAAPYFKSASDKLPYLPYSNLDDYGVWGANLVLRQNGTMVWVPA